MTTNLEKWLLDPKTAKFLGRAATLKVEVLAMLADSSTGDTLTAIAGRHGVSRQAVSRQLHRATLIYLAQ